MLSSSVGDPISKEAGWKRRFSKHRFSIPRSPDGFIPEDPRTKLQYIIRNMACDGQHLLIKASRQQSHY